MAVASVGTSGGAEGAIGYVLKSDREKEPTVIGRAFGTKEEITKQFDALFRASSRSEKSGFAHLDFAQTRRAFG